MIREMNLHNEPFNLIKQGTKTIELRLYDEKRQQIKVGDTIVFTNRSTNEKISTLVTNLYIFNSFDELYKQFDKVSMGYNENEKVDPSDMEIYYPKEEQQKYGVVGIEIKVLKDIRIKKNNYQFLLRTSAIIYNKDKSKILLFNSEGRDFYMLPGGKIRELETSQEAIKREIKEETDYDITNIKFRGISEEKAFDKGTINQQIEIIYECLYEGDIRENKFNGKEGKWITLEWIEISKIDEYKILPKGLKEMIKNKNINNIMEGYEDNESKK